MPNTEGGSNVVRFTKPTSEIGRRTAGRYSGPTFYSGGGGGGDQMLEQRVTNLESDVSHIKADLSDVKQDIRSIKGWGLAVILASFAAMATIYVQIGSNDKQINQLLHGFQLHANNELADLKSDARVMKSDISVLKEDVSTLKTDVSSLRADVGSIKNDLAAILAEIKK